MSTPALIYSTATAMAMTHHGKVVYSSGFVLCNERRDALASSPAHLLTSRNKRDTKTRQRQDEHDRRFAPYSHRVLARLQLGVLLGDLPTTT